MSANDLRCWNCGHALNDVPLPISRHAQCAQCFEALHCCRLCRYFRANATGQCDEERADPPTVKENANFCEWFQPDSGAFSGTRPDRRAAAQQQLDALFGRPGEDTSEHDQQPDPAAPQETVTPDETATPEALAKAKLDDLFSKK